MTRRFQLRFDALHPGTGSVMLSPGQGWGSRAGLKILWWQKGFPFIFAIKEWMMFHGSLSCFLLFLEYREYYFL